MPQQIMVATRHKALFAGVVPDEQDLEATAMRINPCRIIGDWGIEKDVNILAVTGPPAESQITVPADMVVQGVIAVWILTPAAWQAWRDGTWDNA